MLQILMPRNTPGVCVCVCVCVYVCVCVSSKGLSSLILHGYEFDHGFEVVCMTSYTTMGDSLYFVL